VLRESPESDEDDVGEDDDGAGMDGADALDDNSPGEDFVHSLELAQSPEDRRREEADRLLAIKLQNEEVKAARRGNNDVRGNFPHIFLKMNAYLLN
jgi:hypothetical protein